MKSFRSYLYSILQLLILALSLVLEDADAILSILLTVIVLLSVIDKLGKAIVLRELISLHGCVICLIMPLVGYKWYTIENPLSRLWIVYMKVPASTYFPYALPAMALFATVISWPFSKQKVTDTSAFLDWYVKRAKPILEKNHKVAYQIIIAGLGCSIVMPFLPSALQYVASLMFFGSFSGFLYVYFNPSMPKRKLILWLFPLYIVGAALGAGMFTVVAYMGMTIFSFLFLGKKMSLARKLIVFVVGVFALVLIQSVKRDYRAQIWNNVYEGNKAELFSGLLLDRASSGVSFFTVESFFFMYVRGNQGFNISLVMRRFPAEKPYDNGTNILTTIAASVVPRVFWPDKPQAGGKFNMEYYAGVKLEGWSTNVGPLGEAYGSFGPTGGIVFMGLLALFIRFAYIRFFWISRKLPLLLFWLPALFFQITYSMETDTLQIMNTLVKGAFFLWIVYKFRPEWFGAKKTNAIQVKRHVA